MTQARAVHSLGSGDVRHGDVEVSGGALEHLVTQVRLPGHLAKLECRLDLLHVLEVSIKCVLGVKDHVDKVGGVSES